MTTNENTQKKVPLFTSDPFKQFVALILAAIAIQSALLSFWKDECGVQIVATQRFERRYQAEAEAIKNIGEIRTDAYTRVYKTWLELNTMANQAYNNGDEDMAQRYWHINDQVLANMSPLLASPYFNFYEKGVGTDFTPPDIAAYEANSYLVEYHVYYERFLDNSKIVDLWRGRFRELASISLFITVGLFLLGKAMNLVGIPPWLLMVGGVLVALFALFRMTSIYTAPMPTLSEEAINAYAQGMGYEHQGKYAEALASFDLAVQDDDTYTRAVYQRGIANRQLGQYEAAITDFEKAIELGKKDDALLTEMAWAYYYMGDFDMTVATWQQMLQNPDSANHIMASLNEGLAYLAAGKAEQAGVSYENGIQLVADLVKTTRAAGGDISGSEWWALDQAATNLDFLYTCWDEQYCEGTPPQEVIAPVGEQMLPAARDLSVTLKEAMVALEYTGELPVDEEIDAVISDFKFFSITQDKNGRTVLGTEGELFNNDARTIMASFIYENMEPGQQVLLKVYLNGVEVPSLRVLEEWQIGAVNGTAELPLQAGGLRFETGYYWVEMYINSQLIEEAGFEMEAAPSSSLGSGDMDAEDIGGLFDAIPPRPDFTDELEEDKNTEL